MEKNNAYSAVGDEVESDLSKISLSKRLELNAGRM
jgi:hypothetical protein